ncbi:HPP family protein [Nonomuraea sp. NPDC050383]|uniref:HPP family protein n=1 Tax=Nonomuraea sp. NPDC050383 TaxID=3364362 RepID=UPI0037980C39
MPHRPRKRRHADHPAGPSRPAPSPDHPAATPGRVRGTAPADVRRPLHPGDATAPEAADLRGGPRPLAEPSSLGSRGERTGGYRGLLALRSAIVSGAPARVPVRTVVTATGAALAALLVLAGVARVSGLALFALPFVASAAIVALAPAAPFAQPRSVVLGHAGATVVALAVTAVGGPSIWTAAVAAALTTAPMLLLRAPHPPAAATAALIGLTAPAPWYLLTPVAVASAVVIASGVLLGRLLPAHRYPAYWL